LNISVSAIVFRASGKRLASRKILLPGRSSS
jgi:hypothetical protein